MYQMIYSILGCGSSGAEYIQVFANLREFDFLFNFFRPVILFSFGIILWSTMYLCFILHNF